MNNKKLYKGRDQKISGVCSGIGEYLGIDPTIIRLIWIVFTLAGGSGILFYIIATLLMNDRPQEYQDSQNYNYQNTNYQNNSYQNRNYQNNSDNNSQSAYDYDFNKNVVNRDENN